MDASHDVGDGVIEEEQDMAAGGSSKRCSSYWFQVSVHTEGGTFRARWNLIQGEAYCQGVLLERESRLH